MSPQTQQEASNANAPQPKGQVGQQWPAQEGLPPAWGAFKGDRVSVSFFKGRVYVWASRQAYGPHPKASVGVQMDSRGLARLSAIAAVASAVAERAEKATAANVAAPEARA